MNARTAGIISSAITVIALLIAGAVLLLGELVALNGFSESEGLIALALSLTGQIIGLVLAALAAGKLTRRFIEKNDLNSILSVLAASFAAICLGLLIAIAAVILSVAIVSLI